MFIIRDPSICESLALHLQWVGRPVLSPLRSICDPLQMARKWMYKSRIMKFFNRNSGEEHNEFLNQWIRTIRHKTDIASSLVEIFLRFSVGFGTLMRKWEIFPKHSFFSVYRNCSPILFLNSQRFPHHFSDFLSFSKNTLTFRKTKN